MVKLFWVDCPECGETFHAHRGELRDSDVKLLCPSCGHRFLDTEAANLVE